MEQFFSDIAIVVIFSAVLSWLAFFTKQPIIIAYIACGVLAGPWGLSLVKGIDFVDAISRMGITLLLFLAGVVLHPRRLWELFRQTMIITLVTCLVFFLAAFGFSALWGFSPTESVFIGLALMFSSTILVVKLLPTTTLHQRRMGSFCIAILIVQDLIAVLLLMYAFAPGVQSTVELFLLPLKGLALIGFALLFEQFVLRPIMHRIDQFHEMLYISALAWCLGMAMLAHALGFSPEVGAFIAGVALARNPLAFFF
jgi:glutathione-regulated potassium-efflux system ancillary protein KefC